MFLLSILDLPKRQLVWKNPLWGLIITIFVVLHPCSVQLLQMVSVSVQGLPTACCWSSGLPPNRYCLPCINNSLARLAYAACASCGGWNWVCKTGLILEQPGLSTEWDQTREILSFHCLLSCGWRAPIDVWESFSWICEPLPLAVSHTSSVSKTLVTSASFFPFVSTSLKWETFFPTMLQKRRSYLWEFIMNIAQVSE